MSVVTFKKTNSALQLEPTIDAAHHKVVIAVDGPAASGKGTLAKMIAERLGYAFLDTGALYRAVGLATLELGGNPSNVDDVLPALAIVKRNLTPELLANPALRNPDVAQAASQVAALPEVRIDLLDYQRSFAKNPPGDVGGAVLDGRDIGTVVCPDADIKFFVTASPEERARRRFEELKHRFSDMTFEKVLLDIQQRDQRDSSRKVAPTAAATDAYVLETTKLSPAQGLEEAVAVIQSRFIAATQADN